MGPKSPEDLSVQPGGKTRLAKRRITPAFQFPSINHGGFHGNANGSRLLSQLYSDELQSGGAVGLPMECPSYDVSVVGTCSNPNSSESRFRDANHDAINNGRQWCNHNEYITTSDRILDALFFFLLLLPSE